MCENSLGEVKMSMLTREVKPQFRIVFYFYGIKRRKKGNALRDEHRLKTKVDLGDYTD